MDFSCVRNDTVLIVNPPVFLFFFLKQVGERKGAQMSFKSSSLTCAILLTEARRWRVEAIMVCGQKKPKNTASAFICCSFWEFVTDGCNLPTVVRGQQGQVQTLTRIIQRRQRNKKNSDLKLTRDKKKVLH